MKKPTRAKTQRRQEKQNKRGLNLRILARDGFLMTVWQQLFTRRMLICVFTGFSSGLPLYLETKGLNPFAFLGVFASWREMVFL